METKHTIKTLCKFCRREFNSFNLQKVCDDCESRMDENFAAIRNYLKEYPSAGIDQVCLALEMTPALIKFFYMEERLETAIEKKTFLKCDCCGIPVSSGRYCRKCEIAEIRRELSGKCEKTKQISKGISSMHLGRGKSTIVKEKRGK